MITQVNVGNNSFCPAYSERRQPNMRLCHMHVRLCKETEINRVLDNVVNLSCLTNLVMMPIATSVETCLTTLFYQKDYVVHRRLNSVVRCSLISVFCHNYCCCGTQYSLLLIFVIIFGKVRSRMKIGQSVVRTNLHTAMVLVHYINVYTTVDSKSL